MSEGSAIQTIQTMFDAPLWNPMEAMSNEDIDCLFDDATDAQLETLRASIEVVVPGERSVAVDLQAQGFAQAVAEDLEMVARAIAMGTEEVPESIKARIVSISNIYGLQTKDSWQGDAAHLVEIETRSPKSPPAQETVQDDKTTATDARTAGATVAAMSPLQRILESRSEQRVPSPGAQQAAVSSKSPLVVRSPGAAVRRSSAVRAAVDLATELMMSAPSQPADEFASVCSIWKDLCL